MHMSRTKTKREGLMVRKSVVVTAVVALMGLASPARADIITFTSFGAFSSASNTFGYTQENVLAVGTEISVEVEGVTNQTGTLVDIQSSELLSLADANGQARVTPGAVGDLSFNNFAIDLDNGATFTSLAFNID